MVFEDEDLVSCATLSMNYSSQTARADFVIVTFQLPFAGLRLYGCELGWVGEAYIRNAWESHLSSLSKSAIEIRP